MEIIYEDKSIIVIDKPAGLATQSANISQKDCVSLIKEHIKKSDSAVKGEPYLGVVHRLDQPVSGILVFAKNPKAAATLSGQVSSDIMNKYYEAKVKGRVQYDETKGEDGITLVSYMYKDAKNSRSVIVDEGDLPKHNNKKDGNAIKKAVLTYFVKEYDETDNTTVLSIKLDTGRFHQIRAQLSYTGHPIIGDRKYGSDVPYNRDFLTGEIVSKGAIALRAVRIEFVHPDSREKMVFGTF